MASIRRKICYIRRSNKWKSNSRQNYKKNGLNQYHQKKEGNFLDILFEILNSTDAKTLSEMSSNWFASAKAVLTTYKNLDSENKEIIIKKQ